MNWKRLLRSLLWNSLWFAALFTAIFGIGGVLHPHPLACFAYLIVVVSVSFNNEGIHKLKSGGHVKFLRIHWISLSLLIISFFVFALLGFGHSVVFSTVMSVMLAICAAIVPMALYLNRKQPESTPQPTRANVS